jgi:hypothetical protein
MRVTVQHHLLVLGKNVLGIPHAGTLPSSGTIAPTVAAGFSLFNPANRGTRIFVTVRDTIHFEDRKGQQSELVAPIVRASKCSTRCAEMFKDFHNRRTQRPPQ